MMNLIKSHIITADTITNHDSIYESQNSELFFLFCFIILNEIFTKTVFSIFIMRIEILRCIRV